MEMAWEEGCGCECYCGSRYSLCDYLIPEDLREY